MRVKESIFSNAKKDVMAGLIVFLIALPLCLGIAQASGAPLFSGIVAGVVGGVVIGYFSGSQLSVSGPAAGLVAIVLAALTELGGMFELFLCAVMVAGVIQVVLGYIKAGGIANYFPTNVIEGMLAGIGLTIIIKQIPDGLGFVVSNHNKGMEDAESGFIFKDIIHAVQHPEIGALIICILGVSILGLWNLKAFKKMAIIPAGLLVVVLGTILNQVFKLTLPSLYLDGDHLVNLPIPESFGNFFAQFTLPNFEGFLNPVVWKTGVVIAVVASIETLLCIEATDKLDPYKRVSSTNKELKAQGLGNIISGLIGGLPITSVIVRSSANINAGGKMKLSTIVHGVLLLVSVATIPFILNMIPKATLAAILIYTGYRLCRPGIFKHMYHNGISQFLPFVVTVLGVVFLDLLKGVGLGMALAIFYILRNNFKLPFHYRSRKYEGDSEVLHLELAQEVTFLNKAHIKSVLENLKGGTIIILDATDTEYIDFDVLEMIKDFHKSKAPDRNIKMSLIGFKNTYEVPEHIVVKDVKEVLPSKNPIKITAGSYKKLMKQMTVEK
jgi:MFS superfamily sulfate permease-like transporter